MSGDDDKKLTAQEAAIIEMLKQQSLEGGDDDDDESGKKKHAFWDTQVCRRHNLCCLFGCSFIRLVYSVLVESCWFCAVC